MYCVFGFLCLKKKRFLVYDDTIVMLFVDGGVCRATFVEDENQFWVKEKSVPIYDPTVALPPEVPPKYVS